MNESQDFLKRLLRIIWKSVQGLVSIFHQSKIYEFSNNTATTQIFIIQPFIFQFILVYHKFLGLIIVGGMNQIFIFGNNNQYIGVQLHGGRGHYYTSPQIFIKKRSYSFATKLWELLLNFDWLVY